MLRVRYISEVATANAGSTPERIWLERDGGKLSLLRWRADSVQQRPPALLMHGTGFTAELWQDVAERMLPHYEVYALDRRGHGHSHKPPAGHYHFADFAEDAVHVIDGLAGEIYGVGHSAGSTDLLLAAKLRPGRFRRIFAMEPTAMQPLAAGVRPPGLSRDYRDALKATLRRRAVFADARAAFERLRSRAAFANWTEAALWRYIASGFEPLSDGRVQLRCLPQIEAAMLEPIYEVMDCVYTGDARGQPFAGFREVMCPVHLTTAQNSSLIYKRMVDDAQALIPGATRAQFEDVGHCVAQEAHERVAAAVLDYGQRD